MAPATIDSTLTLVPTPRLRRSPFYDATVAAGVVGFTVYNRMLLPLSYGDDEADYWRLLTTASLWDVGAQRQIEIVGPHAAALVQYLTSCDLTTMTVGEARYVALCDHDGTILNDPVLLKLADDRFWFSLADNDMALWARAVAVEGRFNVRVFEPDVSPLAVQGPRAEDILVELLGPDIGQLGHFRFVEATLAGIPVVVCRSGWSKQDGFELYLCDGSRGHDLWDRVLTAGEPYGIGPGAPHHVERVESGLLSWGGDNTPRSNPFEVGMARYVDVETPVDYIGKIALQKVAAEGPARLLVGVFIDTDTAEPGPLSQRTAITRHDAVVGTLSAVVWSPRLERMIGLAQIDRSIVEAGAPVEVIVGDRTRKATITSLPFL